MSILSNFRNPWEADRGVLESDVLDMGVLENDVLSNDVLKPPTPDKIKGTHFYDEEGNLLYKSKYGERAITIVFKEYIKDIKNLEKHNTIIVAGVGTNTKEIDENYVKILRKRYGHTYLINEMLEIYEKSKTDKRTVYQQYDENGKLKIPAFLISDNNDFTKLAKIPVEVACPLSLNEYGEVIVGDYETELAIGDSPLHIYDTEIDRIKNSIKYYSVGFLHTEPVIGLKNISEKNGRGIYSCESFHPESKSPSGFDEDEYKPKKGYFSVIIRPNYIVFFRTQNDYFKILKKNLPK